MSKSFIETSVNGEVAMSPSDSIGSNIRRLRSERGLTLTELARLSDMTRGYLSLVERSHKSPSIMVLLRIAAALGVNTAELFGTERKAPSSYTLVRNSGHGTTDHGDLELFPLAPGRIGKHMEPFLVRPPVAGIASSPKAVHGGEEMMLVLSGSVEVRLGGEALILGERDCIYFSGEERHEIRSLGPHKAEVLIVVSMPAQRAT
ncbi:MAG: XRE family transcriptional regulator [Shinella sp.]|nr:MAG: XRE family transcriptional regulator [Shinella sp.]